MAWALGIDCGHELTPLFSEESWGKDGLGVWEGLVLMFGFARLLRWYYWVDGIGEKMEGEEKSREREDERPTEWRPADERREYHC